MERRQNFSLSTFSTALKVFFGIPVLLHCWFYGLGNVLLFCIGDIRSVK